MIIYRTSDRIPVEIGEIKLLISPLSFSQKAHIANLTQVIKGQEVQDMSKLGFLCVKYGVKGVTGLKNSDGTDFSPEFEPNGTLTDESTEDLLAIEAMPQLISACTSLYAAIAEHKIDGVKIDLSGVHNVKKQAP